MNQEYRNNLGPLYTVVQFSALTMLMLIPLQIVIYVMVPPPDTVQGFFELYQQNPFFGLLSLDFLYLFNNTIIVILYLALFIRLCREKLVLVLIALTFGLIGVTCYYSSNPAFEMLTLSHQALPEQQTIYLAAGEALMAGYTGTAFNVYYVLNTLCLLLFSYAISKALSLKSPLAGGALLPDSL
ncbi:hypothetical protein [Brassicibacter mesophilus]|uniref:hypothetical protein n=1 Tax=Brassicibacter mesophilus TaxID=745119 RepID=UPI003D23413D